MAAHTCYLTEGMAGHPGRAAGVHGTGLVDASILRGLMHFIEHRQDWPAATARVLLLMELGAAPWAALLAATEPERLHHPGRTSYHFSLSLRACRLSGELQRRLEVSQSRGLPECAIPCCASYGVVRHMVCVIWCAICCASYGVSYSLLCGIWCGAWPLCRALLRPLAWPLLGVVGLCRAVLCCVMPCGAERCLAAPL